jgi:hypothetical protein
VQHTGTTDYGYRKLYTFRRAMPELHTLFLAACMVCGAALYTSVGHAGASAYE